MKRGRTEAETCALNGWTVGTRLVGDEGYGSSVIEITAIGRSDLLVVRVSHNGVPERYPNRDRLFTLQFRDWELAPSPGEQQ